MNRSTVLPTCSRTPSLLSDLSWSGVSELISRPWIRDLISNQRSAPLPAPGIGRAPFFILVGQPTLPAAGFQRALDGCEDSRIARKSRLKGGCRQDCLPHNLPCN